MGQILPGNEKATIYTNKMCLTNTKAHLDRKNNTMFRHFVLDKIYAREDTTNTQANIDTKPTSDEDINSIMVATKTKQEPFTITGTRLKVRNSSLDSSQGYALGSAKHRNNTSKKYE